MSTQTHLDAEAKIEGPVYIEGQGDERQRNRDDYAPDHIQQAVDDLNNATSSKAYKRYMRKLDLIILPAITLLYFLEYLDRGNAAVSMLPIPLMLPIRCAHFVVG